MTISSTIRKAGPFTGDGAVTFFPFTFKVFSAADLLVVQTAAGVEVTKALASDYTVVLNANQNTTPGGALTMMVAPPAGSTLTFTSAVANLQSLDVTNGGGFYPAVLNNAFDKATILIQQLAEKLGRSLQLPLSSTASATLPVPVATRLLAWNSAGTAIENVDASGFASLIQFGSSGVQVFTTAGSTTSFTLTKAPGGVNNTQVYFNGVYQEKSTYLVSGSLLVFAEAPPAGNVEVVTIGVLPLGASTSDLINYTPLGTGAVARTTQDKLREIVSVRDFGSFGNGTTNDTFAFVAACASLGSKGGTITYSDKHLIDTAFTVPPNITIQGPYGLVGSPKDNGSANYGNMAALIINSTVTVSLSGGSGHRGGLVYRKGLTFPTADSSAFGGIAFTAIADDAFMIDSMVLGFNTAYTSNGMQRPRLFNNWLDNINGLVIKVCFDIAHIHDNHAWPFATIVGNPLGAAYQRTGTAYLFQDGGDWNKCTNNFSYGYSRGTQIINCNSMTLLSCSHDNTQQNANSIGIEILGTSNETRILGCQVAAHNVGIHIATNAGTHTYIEGTQTWVNSLRGVLIDGGNVTINGGGHRATPEGVTVNNSASTVFVDNATFVTCPVPVNVAVLSTTVRVGNNNMFPGAALGLTRAGNTSLQSVVSASAININPEDTVVTITGTTNIGTILTGNAGRTLTLVFTTALSVLHSVGVHGIRLNGAVNFAVISGSTLSLMHNGGQWFETGRSV